MESTTSIKRRYIIAFIGTSFFTIGLCYSLLPSFYPSKAKEKGATPTQYGLTFGCYSLASLLSSPLMAQYGHRLASTQARFLIGFILHGLSVFFFGCLDNVNDTTAFIALSYLLRILQGLSRTICYTATLSILMKLVPEKAGMMASFVELSSGLGIILGPVIGNLLYQTGGFSLPFFSLGLWPAVTASWAFILLPKGIDEVEEKAKEYVKEKSMAKQNMSVKSTVTTVSVLIPFLDVLVSYYCQTFIAANAELFIKDNGGTAWHLGVAFVSASLAYVATSVIAGQICDRYPHASLVSLAGNATLTAAFAFVGPLPFIPVKANLALIASLLVLSCGAYGLVNVAAFSRAYTAAKRQGFEESTRTSLALSGMFNAFDMLGAFLGPTASGVLIENYDVPHACLVPVALSLVMMALNLVCLVKDCGHVAKARELAAEPDVGSASFSFDR